DWLYEALHRFGFANQPTSVGRGDGLRLLDCYVTAAARCAPPKNRPTPGELANCRPWLESELALLSRVRVVIALGKIAHDAFLAATHNRARFAHGALTHLPDGTVLLASYHPSRQNTNTGRLTRSMWYAIFRGARECLRRSGHASTLRRS
ncbi:MAG: uracil-DNA glycosylase family protein, partial [Gemmatimonadales bacterium]